MKNGFLDKWMLFISSYFPLYIWLLLSNYDYSKPVHKQSYTISGWIFVVLMVIFIIISSCQLISVLRDNGSTITRLGKSVKISPESDSLMNYVITYITPFLTLNVHDPKTLLSNLFLFFVIGLIYVGSSATFLNPVLGLLGYKVFGIDGFGGGHHFISKLSFDELERSIRQDKEVMTYRIGEGTYMVKPYRQK